MLTHVLKYWKLLNVYSNSSNVLNTQNQKHEQIWNKNNVTDLHQAVHNLERKQSQLFEGCWQGAAKTGPPEVKQSIKSCVHVSLRVYIKEALCH